MSYILEALRKAEAERRRGAVPDLHAQQLPAAGSAGIEPPAARSPLRPGLAGAALLVAGAVAAWVWLGRQEMPPPVVLPAPAAAPPATAPPMPPTAAAEPPATRVAAAPPATPPAAAADASVPARKLQPAPKREAAPAAAPAKAPAAARTPALQPAQPNQPVQPPSAAQTARASVAGPAKADPALPAAEAAATRIPALAELPGELRQQVPALAIGGSVYSPQASARMVVVNGQVFQEGSALTPELKLEQIRQKSAVFSIRGTRFEMPL